MMVVRPGPARVGRLARTTASTPARPRAAAEDPQSRRARYRPDSRCYNRLRDDDRPDRDQSRRPSSKPVIRGTRVAVESLLRKLSEGATEADLLDAHPRL